MGSIIYGGRMDRQKKTIKGKKGEFSLQYFLISILFVGLISGIIIVTVNNLSLNSDVQDFNNTYIENYRQQQLYEDLDTVKNESDDVNILDSFIPDIIGTFVQKAIKPIKTAINSVKFMNSLINGFFQGIGMDSSMANMFTMFFYGVITIVLIIGFLLIKMYMGRNDGRA